MDRDRSSYRTAIRQPTNSVTPTEPLGIIESSNASLRFPDFLVRDHLKLNSVGVCPVPKISVCIPTYNRVQLLPQAIHSVLEQTEWDFELIVCDDGSTDVTE